MKTLNLTRSSVVFDQEAHTYHLDGVELSGVTTMLKKMLFADKYAGISEEVLAKAAQYGTSVHEGVELFETLGADDGSLEVKNYRKLKEMAGFNFEESEYLVSDNKTIASSIDLVFTDHDGGIWLADIKTTYGGLDKEYLSWQLSVYAYLFEMANPNLKVKGLIGIWLRHDEFKLDYISRKHDAYIERLIYEYADNLECTLSKSDGLPAEVHGLADAIASMEKQIKTITAQRDELKEKMLEVMRENNCDKVDIDGKVLITRVAATTRESLDSKSLKADNPELYAKYVKTSPVKESLKITVRS